MAYFVQGQMKAVWIERVGLNQCVRFSTPTYRGPGKKSGEGRKMESVFRFRNPKCLLGPWLVIKNHQKFHFISFENSNDGDITLQL